MPWTISRWVGIELLEGSRDGSTHAAGDRIIDPSFRVPDCLCVCVSRVQNPMGDFTRTPQDQGSVPHGFVVRVPWGIDPGVWRTFLLIEGECVCSPVRQCAYLLVQTKTHYA